MHVVIVGCGRVGSTLARELCVMGNTVAVVDRRADAFLRLGDDFAGQTVVGIGFDPDILVAAGIERADALVAVTSGDNSNIMIARVGRERYGIERVVARIYDPKRAEIYERLGIATYITSPCCTSTSSETSSAFPYRRTPTTRPGPELIRVMRSPTHASAARRSTIESSALGSVHSTAGRSVMIRRS
ncbi:MAG: potassium channel family protein, partial [Actinomycetota bacterium]